uniref:Uncharacterized protein n=1 Tax=Zea mays TaxID=4577 RepID=C4J8P4_MAIZE|nr:unknown [Zea mays]
MASGGRGLYMDHSGEALVR